MPLNHLFEPKRDWEILPHFCPLIADTVNHVANKSLNSIRIGTNRSSKTVESG